MIKLISLNSTLCQKTKVSIMKLSCIRERNELMLSSSSPLNLHACANSLVPSNKHPQTYYLASEWFFKLLFQDERRTEGEAVEKYLYLIYPIAVFPLWTTPKHYYYLVWPKRHLFLSVNLKSP